MECLPHLPAWPKLQALLLDGVHPTCIKAEHLALLQAAPCLRRLKFSSSVRSNDEQQRMEVRRVLGPCASLFERAHASGCHLAITCTPCMVAGCPTAASCTGSGLHRINC